MQRWAGGIGANAVRLPGRSGVMSCLGSVYRVCTRHFAASNCEARHHGRDPQASSLMRLEQGEIQSPCSPSLRNSSRTASNSRM